jgi:secernin
MCDTFTYRSGSRIWFGKNSDREPNEAHEVIFVKGRAHPLDARVKCTYIEIPQASATLDVILCKPVWMWGAEMGVNSAGVVIGNEAIFTRGNPPRDAALTGMDLLRLALERSSSAREALECIIGLLSQYGQGGNCGYSHPFYYNNSFLIADRKETWVLETIGKDWAARKFLTSTAISNGLTMHSDWDDASPGFTSLRDLAGEKSDPIVTKFSQAGLRRSCVLDEISSMQPDASIQQAFNVLRTHYGPGPIPTDSITANTVCMHAGFGPIRIDQTTGSLVVDLSQDNIIIWITGTSAPCLGVFRPVLFSDYQKDIVISSEADWWANEAFHRRALFCPDTFVHKYMKERDDLETGFIALLTDITAISDHIQTNAAEKFLLRKNIFQNLWKEKADKERPIGGHFFYRNTWRRFNKEANLKIDI